MSRNSTTRTASIKTKAAARKSSRERRQPSAHQSGTTAALQISELPEGSTGSKRKRDDHAAEEPTTVAAPGRGRTTEHTAIGHSNAYTPPETRSSSKKRRRCSDTDSTAANASEINADTTASAAKAESSGKGEIQKLAKPTDGAPGQEHSNKSSGVRDLTIAVEKTATSNIDKDLNVHPDTADSDCSVDGEKDEDDTFEPYELRRHDWVAAQATYKRAKRCDCRCHSRRRWIPAEHQRCRTCGWRVANVCREHIDRNIDNGNCIYQCPVK